jgi:ribosomal protein S18 acetylase RimI-like enzyme
MVHITAGTTTDLGRLRDLWLSLHHHHLAIATYPTPTDDNQSWQVRQGDYRKALNDNTGFLFLAVNTDTGTGTEFEKDPIGYAMVLLHPGGPNDTFVLGPTYAELYTLVVTPEQRDCGIGTQLLDAVETELRNRGIDELEIGVMANNTAAVKFYERHGARPVETMLWKFGLRNAANPGRQPHHNTAKASKTDTSNTAAASTTIRTANDVDADAIRDLAIANGMFSADDMAGFNETMAGFFDGTLEGHSWIVAVKASGDVVGAAYYAPEPFADRLWNLYFLAVAATGHRDGTGTALIGYVERTLRDQGDEVARVLVVETSSLDAYAQARAFYVKQGFEEEARIRDFYGPGDNKVVYWKALTP